MSENTDVQSLVGQKGEFTAAWGEVCQCTVTGIDEDAGYLDPQTMEWEPMGTALVIAYVTRGHSVTNAILPPSAFRPSTPSLTSPAEI